MISSRLKYFVLILLFSVMAAACSTSRRASIDVDFSKSKVDAETLVQQVPDYSTTLHTATGKGRAIVSEPGGSDRVTIDFMADRQKSLLIIQNRIGIEGGKMLVDQDSILIYNRVDKVAQKISIYDGKMTSLNELASVNILDLLNFKVNEETIEEVYESNNLYLLRLDNGSQVYVNKEHGWVEHVFQTRKRAAPYSEIIYESYGKLEGFTLPRKITIFSGDETSRVVFLIRDLQVNTNLPPLEIEIPDDITIYRR